MNIQASKKSIYAVAALMIICFHLWIPVFSKIESFILLSSYIAVDIFFFISAYSMSKRPIENKEQYLKFILNRGIKLLPLFLIALAFGHFLWFIPALMLVYLIFPIVHQSKQSIFSFLISIIAWALLTYILFGIIGLDEQFGIFIFRIPIIILGAYAKNVEDKIDRKTEYLLSVLLLIIGSAVLLKFGYLHKLNTPYQGSFYLFGIPSSIALILLIDAINQSFELKALKPIGDASLEIYFIQFIIGPSLLAYVYKLTGIKILTNIIVIGACILVAIMLQKITKRWLP